MAGVTDTQSIRFGQVTDIITHTMQANLADDVAAQLDAADAASLLALKRPAVYVTRISQAFTAGVTASVSFDTIQYDTTGTQVNLGTFPTRVTVGATAGAGIYMVHGVATYSTTGSPTATNLSVLKNGTTLMGQRMIWGGVGALDLTLLVYAANTTDYFELQYLYIGSGTPTVTFGQFWVHKISL